MPGWKQLTSWPSWGRSLQHGFAAAAGLLVVALVAVGGIAAEQNATPKWAFGAIAGAAVGGGILISELRSHRPRLLLPCAVLVVLFSTGGAFVARVTLPTPGALLLLALFVGAATAIAILTFAWRPPRPRRNQVITTAVVAALATGLVIFTDDARYRPFPGNSSSADIGVFVSAGRTIGPVQLSLQLGYEHITGSVVARLHRTSGKPAALVVLLPRHSKVQQSSGAVRVQSSRFAIPGSNRRVLREVVIVNGRRDAALIAFGFRWQGARSDPYGRDGLGERTFWIGCIGAIDSYGRGLPRASGLRPIVVQLIANVGERDRYLDLTPPPQTQGFGQAEWRLGPNCRQRIGMRVTSETAARIVSIASDGFFLAIGFLAAALYDFPLGRVSPSPAEELDDQPGAGNEEDDEVDHH